jgi:hypothetical protein
MRWMGHVAYMQEMINVYKVSVRKHKGKKLLGRPRKTWKDNIKMDLNATEYKVGEWISLAQNGVQ